MLKYELSKEFVLPLTAFFIGAILLLQSDDKADSLFYPFIAPMGLVCLVIGVLLACLRWQRWHNFRNLISCEGRRALGLEDAKLLNKAIEDLGEIGAFSSQQQLIELALNLNPKLLLVGDFSKTSQGS